ncbi:MAG: hypothetical protein V4507_15435 [Verrucomicrobiota bacterium]
MNRDEALKILLSVRSREEGAGDSLVEEAFLQMESDPELKQAWEAQQKWDRAIKQSIPATPIPQDLKQRILSRKEPKKSRISKIIPFPPSLWLPWAAAALLVFGLGIWKIERQEEERNFALFEVHAVDYTRGFFMLSKHSEKMDEIRGWLSAHHSPYTFQILFHTAGMEQLGCRQVEFCGIRSSMVCFEIEGLKKEVHLFIVDKDDIKNLPPYGVPAFSEKHGNALACWTDDRHGYVLTGNIPMEELKKLF